MRRNLTGFVRIIRYIDLIENGKQPDYITYIYEGQMAEGEPSGFFRIINSERHHSFVGFLSGYDHFRRGTGLYFLDGELKYYGFYEEGSLYRDSPKLAIDFK